MSIGPSLEGRGTCATFDIIADDAPPTLHRFDWEDPLVAVLLGKRVILTSRSPELREQAASMIACWGAQVVHAQTVKDALRALQHPGEPPVLAIFDLPSAAREAADPVRAVRQLPEPFRDVPVFLMVPPGQDAALPPRMKAEAAIVSKPLVYHQLGAALWRHFRGPQTVERAPKTPKEPVAADSRPLVLVAEDNPANQLLMRALFERDGWRVEIAGNGREAVEALRQISPSVLVMDVQMPELDGAEATRLIRGGAAGADKTRVPIIGLTAHVHSVYQERMRDAGIDAFLTKPVTPDTLLACVQDVLKGRGANL